MSESSSTTKDIVDDSHLYILCNKDRELAEFECQRDGADAPRFQSRSLLAAPQDLPLGIDATDGAWIHEWLQRRRVPRRRENGEDLLSVSGCFDLEGFVQFSHCASLQDTFWVKRLGEDVKWESVSFYRNDFDAAMAKVAFDGRGRWKRNDLADATSPELSTDGGFVKCWTRQGADVFLLKGGKEWFPHPVMEEPFCEVLAYQVSRELCDEAVPYELCDHHGLIVSRCPLFTSESVGYAPIASLLRSDRFDEIMGFYDRMGAGERFRQMMVLDALTLNQDRHLGNFGVLFDADTMEIKGMAPVFDNNLGFCSGVPDERLADPADWVDSMLSWFGPGFNAIAIRCLTPEIRRRLERMRGFKFDGLDELERMGFSKKRAGLLEAIVNFQIKNILDRRMAQVPAMPEANVGPVQLDSMLFVIGEVADELLLEGSSMSGVELVTADGRALQANGCKFFVNKGKDGWEIDVYQANVIGDCEDLRVVSVKGIRFATAKPSVSMEFAPLALTVQLSRGNDSLGTISTLDDVKVCIASEEHEKSRSPATVESFTKTDVQETLKNASPQDESQRGGFVR